VLFRFVLFSQTLHFSDDGGGGFAGTASLPAWQERLMKPVAIGRKIWLFIGSMEAGSRAAVLMSLVASCKLNEVEP